MKTVAITGGSGFVGSAIYRECLRRKEFKVVLLDKTKPEYQLPENVSWIECDTTDIDLVRSSLKAVRPDHLYLIAGVLGTTELNRDPLKAVKNNIDGVATFMNICIEENVFPKLFYVTKPNVWENMYTITKETSERIIKLYMKEFNLKGCIHRWFNAYGPGQHTHPIRKAVPYFILNAFHNKPLEIWGDGSQTVDLIHIDDIAYLAVEAMNKDTTTQDHVIDLGTGIPVTVKDLAEMIIRLTGSKSEIIYKGVRPGGVENTILVADTTDLNQYICSDYKFKDLESGMEETIEYYKNLSKEHLDSFFAYYNSKEHEACYFDSRSTK